MDTFVDRLHRSNSNNNSSTGNNSTSRRLRSNGSMKGGHASPMFPTNGKKRAFENPEPSSPKVTCIGQVRVKTKKQGNKLRTRSKKRGEMSFRRVDQNSIAFEGSNNHQDLMNNQFLNQQQQQEDLSHRNQRWVHLPVTICETLRAFGAEFNCFLPCRSSCTASEKEKEEKAAAAGSNNNGSSSCGAVFARWLVSVQEEEGKGREIEVVVGEEVEDERDERRRSYRRHVYEEIEFKDEKFGGNEGLQEEEEARVNICIPPKNALLLMRCRSDPVKMAALSNKFWEAPAPQDEEDEEEDYEKDTNLVLVEEKCIKVEDKREVWQESITEHREDLFVAGNLDSFETIEEHHIQETGGGLVLLEGGGGADSQQAGSTDENIDGVLQERNLVKQEEEEPEIHEVMNLNPTSSTRETVRLCRDQSSHDQEFVDPDALMNHENENKMDQENAVDFSDDIEKNSVSVQFDQESLEAAVEDLQDQEQESHSVAELQVQESEEEEKEAEREEEEQTVTHERSKPEDPKTQEAGQTGTSVKSRERDNGQPLLPDCLLLMMCEPKLSMEVSKETWVCSTDFIRWLPEHSRPVNKANGKDEPKKRVSIDRKPAPEHHSNNNNNLQQPARSSCSYPGKPPAHGAGTESMSTMLEQKLVGAKAYDPFVLTRCKSEPMRSASKLAPEACFWMNRKLEPHGPAASLGLGAAGVGF
ncbi:CHLOROPLAST PROTEIN HCF243 [Salix koriyanagi]|uniref:CHLOROPLAST PROTEIN HCF243 n=1 Tax=Salix koriyanagi TaxID=2511006 RepID=A0A9Q0WZ48_9ROSI|nr:CHLOROPLAST PROTEIN HCF243 [Salix koriyanagi]